MSQLIANDSIIVLQFIFVAGFPVGPDCFVYVCQYAFLSLFRALFLIWMQLNAFGFAIHTSS